MRKSEPFPSRRIASDHCPALTPQSERALWQSRWSVMPPIGKSGLGRGARDTPGPGVGEQREMIMWLQEVTMPSRVQARLAKRACLWSCVKRTLTTPIYTWEELIFRSYRSGQSQQSVKFGWSIQSIISYWVLCSRHCVGCGLLLVKITPDGIPRWDGLGKSW